MLRAQAKEKHISFHTPGHKQKGLDITELSYSDNLSCPKGCILKAEQDVTAILGSKKSFILTDGSTSGVLSMLHAAKTLGAKTVCCSQNTHKSVFNGCALLGLSLLTYTENRKRNIPYPTTMYEMNEVLLKSDAVLLTYPDYYGNLAPIKALASFCKRENKLLLIDGAHGSHLHYDKEIYGGVYADMWVDGVHKNLPSYTQGAIVSANTEACAKALEKAVDVFRTTSPSYPIMASVEYAVKYPENILLKSYAENLERSNDRFYFGGDWTKLCVKFGEFAFEAEKQLQKQGLYPEFCDGNVLLFYLSPALKIKDLKKLERALYSLFKKFPYRKIEAKERTFDLPPAPSEREWIPLSQSENRLCAATCGLFPPCFPLLLQGERITKDKIELLSKSDNAFGLHDNKICVYKEE